MNIAGQDVFTIVGLVLGLFFWVWRSMRQQERERQQRRQSRERERPWDIQREEEEEEGYAVWELEAAGGEQGGERREAAAAAAAEEGVEAGDGVMGEEAERRTVRSAVEGMDLRTMIIAHELLKPKYLDGDEEGI